MNGIDSLTNLQIILALLLLCLFRLLARLDLLAAELHKLPIEPRGDKRSIILFLARPFPNAGVQLRVVLLHKRFALRFAPQVT